MKGIPFSAPMAPTNMSPPEPRESLQMRTCSRALYPIKDVKDARFSPVGNEKRIEPYAVCGAVPLVSSEDSWTDTDRVHRDRASAGCRGRVTLHAITSERESTRAPAPSDRGRWQRPW